MITCALAVWLSSVTAFARQHSQLWIAAQAEQHIDGDWRLSEEAIARISDRRGGLYEIESTLALGRRVTPDITIWAAYVYNPQYVDGRFDRAERRARQQVNVDHLLRLGPVTLSGRVRLEERWRSGLAGTGWRLRPFVRFTLPIASASPTTLNLTHESFFDLNRTAFQRNAGFDRMRNAIALRTPLFARISLEVGYLNQVSRQNVGSDEHAHVATITLILASN